MDSEGVESQAARYLLRRYRGSRLASLQTPLLERTPISPPGPKAQSPLSGATPGTWGNFVGSTNVTIVRGTRARRDPLDLRENCSKKGVSTSPWITPENCLRSVIVFVVHPSNSWGNIRGKECFSGACT